MRYKQKEVFRMQKAFLHALEKQLKNVVIEVDQASPVLIEMGIIYSEDDFYVEILFSPHWDVESEMYDHKSKNDYRCLWNSRYISIEDEQFKISEMEKIIKKITSLC